MLIKSEDAIVVEMSSNEDEMTFTSVAVCCEG